MRKTVNATRMELLRLKRRAEMAKRGHKLLKDKLDGLIQKFFTTYREYKKLTDEIETELKDIFSRMILVQSVMSKASFAEAILSPKMIASVEVGEINIMGVRAPKYQLKLEGETDCYGYADTSAELDNVLLRFSGILPKLVEYAAKNKTLELLSQEIALVKRRVNALEHVLIPELDDSSRFIRMKLSEMERGYLTGLMKLKDIVRAH